MWNISLYWVALGMNEGNGLPTQPATTPPRAPHACTACSRLDRLVAGFLDRLLQVGTVVSWCVPSPTALVMSYHTTVPSMSSVPARA
ncbi:MAG: hypothetical protein R3B67_08720 [Phycisphaerales bacterium]